VRYSIYHIGIDYGQRQLRPKVNNYALTVEKGDGYDLNRSLFERLVRKGYPHSTLSQQHRMRPEISALVRNLMYPDLTDAPKTLNRENLRGVQDNLVFIDHQYPEGDWNELAPDQSGSEPGRKSSKSNRYEVLMIMKILRYLGQQVCLPHTLIPYLISIRAMGLRRSSF
jgi:superfamily I DNA and/or RNA helicase